MANLRAESLEEITAIETDFHQWALDTAAALEKRQFANVDWPSVIEELRGLSRSEERELEARLSQLMYYLLKQQYQPERQCRSWEISIRNQRQSILALVRKQPSLGNFLYDPEFWHSAYRDALSLSGNDSLPDSVTEQFPEVCPFTKSILDFEFSSRK